MKTKRNSILRPVMRSIVIIVAIILCFAYMFYQASKSEYEEKMIVNVLGKQRMLTQMIAKDANRLYTLIQSRETGKKTIETEQSIDEKIKETKESLSLAGNEFNRTLEAMHSGHFESNGEYVDFKKSITESRLQMQEVGNIWAEFQRLIQVMVTASETNSNVFDALIYIDSNNEKLLKACDAIIQNVIDDAKNSAKRSMNISIALLILSLVVIGFSLYNLYKYIIGPFNELFKGISRIGLGSQLDTSSMPTKKELITVVSEIDEMFLKIEKLISLIENMNKNSSFNEILKFIYEAFSSFIPYSYIGIALVKENGKVLEASYGISDGSIHKLPHSLLGKKYFIKDTGLAKIIESGNARIINDLEEYTRGKPMKEYNMNLLNAGIHSSITLPLKVNTEPVGIIFFSSRHKNIYNMEHVKFLETLVNSIAISFDRNIFTDELLYSSLLALVKLAESRDEDTGDHLDRMRVYSRSIATYLLEESKYSNDISPEYINNIERFSPMHDIGKVGIRDGILLKPGKLTEEEFDEMKKHALYGADVLRTAEANITRKGRSVFQLGIEIAEGHHEKWDGSGYPYGKRGEAIPLSARIVAVADVFDALTSKRPYKKAFTFEDSFNIILQGSGKHFDPEIVRVFEANRDSIYEIYAEFYNKSGVAKVG